MRDRKSHCVRSFLEWLGQESHNSQDSLFSSCASLRRMMHLPRWVGVGPRWVGSAYRNRRGAGGSPSFGRERRSRILNQITERRSGERQENESASRMELQ